eukprot:1841016-Pyramimonas_sp.AAC.1
MIPEELWAAGRALCLEAMPPFLRLVLTLGTHCLVHAASPPAIGSHAGYIPPPLLRLVLTLGTYRLPSRDWFSRW